MNQINPLLNGTGGAPSSPSKTEKGNPTLMIQNKLQAMRTAREKTISTIYSLEQEKKTIEQILPKIYFELQQIQDKIANNINEANIYSNAISEIEQNYGEFIYSAHFFDNDEN